jgi:hypothetical protein
VRLRLRLGGVGLFWHCGFCAWRLLVLMRAWSLVVTVVRAGALAPVGALVGADGWRALTCPVVSIVSIMMGLLVVCGGLSRAAGCNGLRVAGCGLWLVTDCGGLWLAIVGLWRVVACCKPGCGFPSVPRLPDNHRPLESTTEALDSRLGLHPL